MNKTEELYKLMEKDYVFRHTSIYDETDGFYEQQKLLTNCLENNKKVVIKKSRQVGESITVLFYLFSKALLEGKNVLFFGCNRNICSSHHKIITYWCNAILFEIELFTNLKNIIGEEYDITKRDFIKIDQKRIYFNHNGGSITFVSAGSSRFTNSCCQDVFDIYYYNEFDFMDNFYELYNHINIYTNNDTQKILSSTINKRTDGGKLKSFYSDKENGYYKISLDWSNDPRFNKNLKWVKKNETIEEKDYTLESIRKMKELGYKPTNDWYVKMCANYGNQNDIYSELDNEFTVEQTFYY